MNHEARLADGTLSQGHDWDRNGVDRSLLRWMLSLRPIDRLRVMERHARGVQQLMELGRKRRERQTRTG